MTDLRTASGVAARPAFAGLAIRKDPFVNKETDMARPSWIDDDSHPDLEAHVGKLEHFSASLADGVIDAGELATQESNLVHAMRAVEGSLSDDQHAKVTKLLAELTAYSVMQTMHELMTARNQKVTTLKL